MSEKQPVTPTRPKSSAPTLVSSTTSFSVSDVSPTTPPVTPTVQRPLAPTPRRARQGGTTQIDSFLYCFEVDKAYVRGILKRISERTCPPENQAREAVLVMDLKHANDCISRYLGPNMYEGIPESTRLETESRSRSIINELKQIQGNNISNSRYLFWTNKFDREKETRPPTLGVSLSPIKGSPPDDVASSSFQHIEIPMTREGIDEQDPNTPTRLPRNPKPREQDVDVEPARQPSFREGISSLGAMFGRVFRRPSSGSRQDKLNDQKSDAGQGPIATSAADLQEPPSQSRWSP